VDHIAGRLFALQGVINRDTIMAYLILFYDSKYLSVLNIRTHHCRDDTLQDEWAV